ncbi:TonB-dependent receptor [Ponticaulis sp.]|uniref:TonB-dependent receptor n=1 Tax=Ponticaulis sp. TaxID=2020902 RepID=UPI000B6AE2F5|nr:TonB-dependent receptor [Ponticaulis sp.]MAI89584.1 TonB-dependent receptor [Ponticaulis sp.]OUY00611.1 MAG: TonB-dependent receptor [Hyphomonadaceae bacterium TMED5]
MNRLTKRLALVALATTAFSPIHAIAQEADAPAAEESRRFTAVQVTAQRREESQLDVPLSVSAFDGELLADLGVADLTEVAKISPNVTLEVSRGTNTTLSAFIRGVGQQDPVSGFEPGVGIYVDDVYLNRPQGAVLDVFDVERIEVLRGPQGTLYGRNTIGGAVKYVTNGLSDEPMFEGRVALGSYEQRDMILNASMPITDTFRIGGAVASLNRAGFGENLFNGDENYNKEILSGRFSAEWDVTPDFDLRLSLDSTRDTSAARQGHRFIPGQLSGAPVLDDVYDTRAGLTVISPEVEAMGGSITGEYRVNDEFTLRNIIAYREDTSYAPIDFDSLPSGDLDVPAIYENDQFSEEFQVQYSGDNLEGLVGFYYLDANSSTVFDVLLDTTGTLLGLPGLSAQTFGDVNTKTWSLFGDFTYNVTDRLALTLGARYTEDTRTSQVLRRTYIGGFSEFFGGSPTLIATTSDFNGEAEFSDFSPRLSLAYDLTDDSNVYFTYAQGFKGGGFDPRGQTTAAPDFDQDGTVSEDEIYDFMQFDPEEVNSYEVGYKASQMGGLLNYSIAAFYSDYSDVQIPGSVGLDTDNDGVNDTFTGVTTNAGAATIWGIEFEGSATFAEDVFNEGDLMNASWSLGYLDAGYDEYIDAFGNDVSDERVVQNTPDWTASLRLAYDTPVTIADNEGSLLFNTLISYRGDSSQFETPNPFLDQEAYTLVDATVRWESESGRFGMTLSGKNLTDERYVVAGYNFVNIVNGAYVPTLGLEGTLTGFYGDPRTFTFGFDFSF